MQGPLASKGMLQVCCGAGILPKRPLELRILSKLHGQQLFSVQHQGIMRGPQVVGQLTVVP